jgi:hypothetical protein
MAALIERTQTNKREDISDALIMCKIDETPFTSMVKKGGEAQNTLTEWPVDVPVAPITVGVVDEQDVSAYENFSGSRTKLQGRVQIFERKPMVSRLAANISNVAGVGSKKEFARAIAKAMIAMKLDMEARFLSNDDSQADNGTVGYETRGAAAWISSSAQSDLPVPAAYRTAAAQIFSGAAMSTLTEDNFKAMLKARFDNTGKSGDLVGFVGSTLKAAIDTWSVYTPNLASNTVVRTVNGEATDRKLHNVVDFINTSFGNVELHLSRHQQYDGASAATVSTAKGALILDMDTWEVGFNEKPTRHDLPNNGGGPRALIESIAVLRCLNPMANCRITPNDAS